jgi:dTDP-4-amino-4,6-dideoxygalactose transaminase
MLMFPDRSRMKTFDYLKNFGFENETEVVMPGTNAKMSEIQALMGLQVLDNIGGILERRRGIDALYRQQLAGVPGIHLPALPAASVGYNYAYFPVEVEEAEFGMSRDALYEALKRYNVYSRRYFYPLVTDFACYRSVSVADPLQTARKVAGRILTLPIFESLPLADVERICECIGQLSARASR